MFKRVDKRRRKKEEEEKLGLDEEVKEILGFQDTDSEESDSDSDDGEEEEEEEESIAEDEEMNSGEEDEDDEEGEEEDPSITVGQALKDPLYIVSVLPDIKACIVCPGKLLKSIKMVQLHRTSNAHIRRFKRFSDSSANAKPNDNAWDILKRNSNSKPKLSLTTSGVSKRAEKKKKAIQARKARREEAKVKAKAKKAKAASESTSTDILPESMKPKSPPKKKRKIEMEQVLPSVKVSTPSTPPPPTKKRNKKESANTKLAPAGSGALEDDDSAREPPNIQDSVKIQDIVKFASNRAKTARSRALSMSKKRKSSD